MRIAWYAAGGFGRAWPTVPRTYACAWPATPTGILFPDSLMGADSCRCAGDATCQAACQSLENPAAGIESYAAATIYSENDPTRLGFNPNDEHAFIAAPNSQPPCVTMNPVPAWCTAAPAHANGLTLFALRKQLDVAASDPYVILKVKGSIAGPWQHRVYKVDFSGAANTFTFPVTVGDKVPKPYPLSLFEDCSGTVVTDLTGTPSWQAADGSVFARADGQMSADFFYSGRVPDKFYPTGGCSRWLPEATVIYNASWPASIPTLLVGQSLANLRAGFPDIGGADAARVVFEGDTAAPSTLVADRELVRLFDPVATRWVPIAVNELDLFRLLKSRAPSHLGRRLVIDEAGPRLGFKGEIQQVSGSDPLLLLNVITQDERAALAVCFDIDDALVCAPKVNSLYAMTRSPYGLPNPADQVLVGLDENGDPIQLENALAKVLSAGAAKGKGYATVAINDGVPGRQVELWPMRVDCGVVDGAEVPYPGVAFTLSGADVFGFDFGLRHGNDFGGEPENVIFDWRRFEVRDTVYSTPGTDWGTRPLGTGLSGRRRALLVGRAAQHRGAARPRWRESGLPRRHLLLRALRAARRRLRSVDLDRRSGEHARRSACQARRGLGQAGHPGAESVPPAHRRLPPRQRAGSDLRQHDPAGRSGLRRADRLQPGGRQRQRSRARRDLRDGAAASAAPHRRGPGLRALSGDRQRPPPGLGAHRRSLHAARQRGLVRLDRSDDRLRHRQRRLRDARAVDSRLPEPVAVAALGGARAPARRRSQRHPPGLQPAHLELHHRGRRSRLRSGLRHPGRGRQWRHRRC
jgi:hypothetical protein